MYSNADHIDDLFYVSLFPGLSEIPFIGWILKLSVNMLQDALYHIIRLIVCKHMRELSQCGGKLSKSGHCSLWKPRLMDGGLIDNTATAQSLGVLQKRYRQKQ